MYSPLVHVNVIPNSQKRCTSLRDWHQSKTLCVVDVSLNSNWQTKLLDTLKVARLNIPHHESVQELVLVLLLLFESLSFLIVLVVIHKRKLVQTKQHRKKQRSDQHFVTGQCHPDYHVLESHQCKTHLHLDSDLFAQGGSVHRFCYNIVSLRWQNL